MRQACSAAAATLICALLPTVATAEVTLFETDDFDLRLGGYASSFSAYRWTGYDTADLLPQTSGLNAAVMRLEWRAGLGGWGALDVQNRLFWSLAPTGLQGASVGLGSTVAPERTLDLRIEIIDEDGVLLEHDLDRLAITFFTPVADVTVGRQAVTWGNSSLFTVADIWTQFSPFELDTSQKRGVDALRGIAYPWDAGELEVIVVDRGELEDLSGGLRAGWTLGASDFYLGGARNYETFWGLMGLAADLEIVRGHGEVALPYDPDSGDLGLPRATVGVDYFGTGFSLIAEYHFNGPGSPDSDGYLEQLSSAAFARGERYFAGRHYAGGAVSVSFFDDLALLSGSAVVNLIDPSTLVSPTFTYQLSQNTSLTVGGYFGLGEAPTFDLAAMPPVDIRSEFGLFGNSVFFQLAGYL